MTFVRFLGPLPKSPSNSAGSVLDPVEVTIELGGVGGLSDGLARAAEAISDGGLNAGAGTDKRMARIASVAAVCKSCDLRRRWLANS